MDLAVADAKEFSIVHLAVKDGRRPAGRSGAQDDGRRNMRSGRISSSLRPETAANTACNGCVRLRNAQDLTPQGRFQEICQSAARQAARTKFSSAFCSVW
jgi:hypothetical protein